ncbi:butyrophilin subfamily 3 member A2-like, partial [Pterocles gutturalis]
MYQENLLISLLDVENAITTFTGNKDTRTKVHHNRIPQRSLKVLTVQCHEKHNMDKEKQLLSYLHTGQFMSSPPNSSITGVIGEGVILPCHVVAENIPEEFSVQWIFHEQSQKITVSGYDGKNKKEKQNERYQGRTEFFHGEFRAGNMSLRLKNVRSSDKGLYSCVVSFNDTYHDVLIELQVAAKGDAPSIFLRSHMKQGIDLTCQASGWFPKPEVIWLDGQGQAQKEASTTKMTMMPAGLYNVVTSMNLKSGSDAEVSCRIVSNLLNTTSESRVLISGLHTFIFAEYIDKHQ